MFWQGFVLLLIAFLEGFTTLAFQMVALRKAAPYVGSSVVLTSVVIGIILLALSAWYFWWWKLTTHMSPQALIKRLQWYLFISAAYYLLIVYPSFTFVLQVLLETIWYLPTLFVFAITFFALPTFLASHTMPIITHISSGTKWYAAWKILFISTIWSFLGSTVTTLLLFPQLWVYWTWILAAAILFFCGLLLGFRKKTNVLHMVILWIYISSSLYFRPQHVKWYYEETPYQTIEIVEWYTRNQHVRVMQMNWWRASSINLDTNTSFFPYIRAMSDIIIARKPARIAVIGAAWCTLPQEIAWLDFVEQLDVIDIDKRVYPIAEQYFLKEQLHPKINPIVQSARGWIYDAIKDWKKYDMIIVDAYNGTSLPDEIVTQEFFAWIKQLSDNIFINMITDKPLTSTFSRMFIDTLRQSFPNIYYKDVSSTSAGYLLWNLIFASFDHPQLAVLDIQWEGKVFTDDKNTVDHHRVALMYNK